MSSSGLARAIPRSHQEGEIACGGLNQKLLVHVLKASHVEPVQSAGIKLMREVPLDPLSPVPLQAACRDRPECAADCRRPLPSPPLCRPSCAGHDRARLYTFALLLQPDQARHRCCDSPCPPLLLRLPQDALYTRLRVSFRRSSRPPRSLPQPRFLDCRSVGGGSAVRGDRNDGAGFHVHRVLGFVGQRRASVL